MVEQPLLVVQGVTKTFPGVKALDRVSLNVGAGQVHALVGENGAGKSTLMNLIAGVSEPDTGVIELDGRSVVGQDEQSAISAGIGMVHQERSLVDGLSIAENVFAGRQPTRAGNVIDRRRMNERTAAILDELGMATHPSTLVRDIAPAEQQLVEIAKSLSHDLKLLILDEPTAALTQSETEHLYDVVKRLTARGVAVVYITHRLAEVFLIADTVTVLKDGQLVGTYNAGEVDTNRLMSLMVGRELIFQRDGRRSPDAAAAVLEVEHLACAPRVHDVSIRVHAGEIVCVAGLIGAGRTEFCEAVFGLRRPDDGRVLIDGRQTRIRHPADAMALGIGMVPEDRKDAGLFLEQSVAQNIVAPNLAQVSNGWVLSGAKIEELSQQAVASLRIATPDIHQPVGTLSGGNQQKVLIGKWLARRPRVLIVDEPTRGVDVGARADLYRILRDLAAGGMALIVVSSDLLEVLALAHRVVVMAGGRTVGEMDGDEATEVGILRLAAQRSAAEVAT